MRVLLLSRYGALGASSRQRFYQFLPGLAEAGIDVTVSTLLDDSYLSRLYARQRTSRAAIVSAYVQRLRAVSHARAFDGLWIEKEVFPWVPFFLEGAVVPRNVPIVADYDDAWFHRYDLHRNAIVRRLLGAKIDAMMANARLVIAGNAYLAAHARTAGARRVEILPTVVDPRPFASASRPEGFTVGWIGTPRTSDYLEALRVPLALLAQEAPLRVVLVGAAPGTLSGLPVEIHPWSAETEAAALSRFSVGIMPLPDGPWERGKCGYKLVQYMAAGLPTVASPVGANTDIVLDERTGFLANDEDCWFTKLRLLRDQPDLAQAMGQAGRARMMEHYSLPAALPRLSHLLRSAFS